jgi:ketosteroid isomerase-like protein
MGHDRAGAQLANEGFYRALEGLDLGAMDALWLHGPWVRCVHPGWEAITGWDNVRRSWEQIFRNTPWIRVTPSGVEVVAFEDVAIVSCSEDITTTQGGDVGLGVTQATNVFVRTPEGWRMAVHHASPVPVRITQAFTGTVQ